MDNIFYKHYSTDKEVFFPYSRDILCQKPIFPTEVLDGGASFFALDQFKTVDGDALLKKIMSDEIFTYWTRDGKFDWLSVYKDFHTADYTHEWEGHIWINRLYILLPLAQKYCITKDAKYARKWIEILKSFFETNPYTRYEDKPVDIVWRDMQVTWRSISIVHSLFLFGDCKEFTEDEWEFIYGSVKIHANHMIGEGIKYAEILEPDNHRLQIATSLLMFGILFPEFFDTQLFIDTAKTIIKRNMDTSIFADGCNNEDSMSYSHFIARLYLEAELYTVLNGYGHIDGCAETVRKQYEFLYHFASPCGTTMQIGDSYSMDAFADIEFVNSFYPLHFSRERKSMLFADSRMAVLRNKRFDLYVDAMDMTEWHQHFGRPQFILYGDKLPLIIDCGGVNYDRGDYRQIITSARCHNVIVCDEIPLKKLPSNESLSVEEFSLSPEKQVLKIKNTVTGEDASFTWVRTFDLFEDRLEITDTVKASRKMHFTSRMHAPDCRTGYFAPLGSHKLLPLRFGSQMLNIATDTDFECDYFPCSGSDNAPTYATVVLRKFFTDDFTEKTVITLKDCRAE